MGRLCGITIDCADPAALAGFWSTLLARPVSDEHGSPEWATVGSRFDATPRLTFQRVPEPRRGTVRLHLDVEVDDVEVGRARVEELGGRWTGDRHDYPGEGVVMVMTDPEGHEFCLVEYRDAEHAEPFPVPLGKATPMRHDEAAAVLARLHDAQNDLYGGGDTAAVEELLTDDVAWHVPGDNAIAGVHRGRADVLAYMLRRRALAAQTMTMYPRELLVGDADHLASRTDGTATIDGVEHHWSTLGLYRLDGERIAECWLLPLDPPAFDAVWSSRS